MLFITGAKDGYEDVKRHQSDRSINSTKILRLAGGGWVNPNATGQKAKSYTLGFKIPVSLGGKKKVQHEKHEAHVEKAHDGVPASIVVTHAPGTELEPDGQMYMHPNNEQDPHWSNTMWEDVRVGDIVMIRNDEAVPADILICSTSEEENVCFVETKNLDGETNLKSRHGVPALSHLRTPADLVEPTFQIHMEAPIANMFQMNGAVVFGSEGAEQEKQPIDIINILLRGTVMRNTRWAVGIVLSTGEHTKIVLNGGRTPSKRSKVERQMNPQV